MMAFHLRGAVKASFGGLGFLFNSNYNRIQILNNTTEHTVFE